MNETLAPSRTSPRRSLLRRQSMSLHNAKGTTVWAEKGCLWITLENDPRDIVLVRGMSFRVDRPGMAVIAAEEDSTLRLFVPPGWRERLLHSLAMRSARAAARWQRILARRPAPYF